MPPQTINNEPSDQDIAMGGQEDPAWKAAKLVDGTPVCVACLLQSYSSLHFALATSYVPPPLPLQTSPYWPQRDSSQTDPTDLNPTRPFTCVALRKIHNQVHCPENLSSLPHNQQSQLHIFQSLKMAYGSIGPSRLSPPCQEPALHRPSRIVVLKYNPNRLSQLQTTAGAGTTTANTTPITQAITTMFSTTNANGASSPAAAAATTPARTSTPTLSGQQQPPGSASRAPSAVPADRAAMPVEAAENGAPTRVYLNTKVTSHVLDGMKVLAREK